MKTPCKICAHDDRPQIDLAYIRGTPLGTIARRHHVSRYLLEQHVRQHHVSELLRLTQEHAELKTSADVRREIEKIYHENQDIKQRMLAASRRFERDGDIRALLVTLKEVINTNDKILDVLRVYVELTPPPVAGVDIAQAVLDIFGIRELPELPDTGAQPALPPAPADAAPEQPAPAVEEPKPSPPAPVQSARDRYRETSQQIARPRLVHDPQADEKIAAAKPVQDTRYQQLLDKAHREGRRLEPGEASPHMLGTDVDFSRPQSEALPTVPECIYRGGERAKCADCDWEFLLSNPQAYREHWLAQHAVK